MRIPGLGRLSRLARRLRRRGLILEYHRVFSPPSDPQRLCVSPERFAAQMEHLSRNFPLVPLGEMLGPFPHRAIAVTFDDGYVDNLTHAKPILERFHVPATVFITTGYVGQDREFWWDEVEALFLKGRGGTVETAATPDPQEAYLEHHRNLRALEPELLERALDGLRSGPRAAPRPGFRAMSPQEIRDLVVGGRIEVGAHSMTHALFSALSPRSQRQELSDSKQRLEEILGRPVPFLAYPFGTEEDVGPAAPALAREVGFELACANVQGPVTSSSDPFWLPRFVVRNWQVDEFAGRVERGFQE